MTEIYAVSIEDHTGRYWTCFDTLENIGSWLARTLVLITDRANVGYSWQPRVTQFVRLANV